MEGRNSVALYLLDSTGALRQAGQTTGIATLDSSGTLTIAQLPAGVVSGMIYQEPWNAATNTPTLPPVSTPATGAFWPVSVAGSTALPGAAGPWTTAQAAIFNGVDWDVVTYVQLAIGQIVASGTAGNVLYLDGSKLLQSAAPGATSGVQAYSAVLVSYAANGAPSVWGLARMLDANQAAAQTALGLGTAAYISSTAGGDLSGTLPSPTVARVAGVTPSAYTLTLLDEVDGPAWRAALGLVIGTDVQAYNATLAAVAAGTYTGDDSIDTVGTITAGVWNGTDVAVAAGGTGGGTPAAARDGVLWASAAAIDPASPYTVAAGVDRVTFASSKTLAPRALSNYADGQTILVTNSSASTITVTITPADGTIDGGASVALSVAAHGVVGCQRVSASAWVSLQPGSGVIPGRLKAYISGGNPLCVVQGWNGSTWVDLGSAVAPDTTQADAAATITPSGTGFTSAAGYTPASDKRSTAWLALWTLSGAGTLGKTWTPTSTGTTVNLETTCDQPAVASYFAGVILGHATTATTWTFGVAYGGSAGAARHVTGISDDDAVTSGACTAAAPAYALLSTAATTGARSYYTGGRTSTNVVEDTIAAPGNSFASPAFGLIAMRPATGGGALTVTAFEAYFYFRAGELT